MNLGFCRLCLALAGAALVHVSGCSANSTNAPGSTSGPINCDAAQQMVPAACANRTCNGVLVPPDKDACTQCDQASQTLGLASDPLTPCSCNHCAAQLASCFQSAARGEVGGDAARDQKCQAIVQCALRTGCAGTDCYCGTGKPLATCLAETTPAAGPCHAEIEAASGCMTTDRTCVAQAQLNAASAVSRAYAVGVCVTGDPSTATPTPGNCHK